MIKFYRELLFFKNINVKVKSKKNPKSKKNNCQLFQYMVLF